eukprot:CAMPEP_0172497602 /NCGR_PEP_ID=MMETSP1066-20121228/102144_1 /TAXON_ID=671091 /ORGANISM="Coscinodiscus wailesii, Strain CCMP2513" /LENGTH=395 /DNA_ID=CAMNT_0013270465 /DNA_START=102 /DNA_END=1289 /DNA_ORIENTATION=-
MTAGDETNSMIQKKKETQHRHPITTNHTRLLLVFLAGALFGGSIVFRTTRRYHINQQQQNQQQHNDDTSLHLLKKILREQNKIDDLLIKHDEISLLSSTPIHHTKNLRLATTIDNDDDTTTTTDNLTYLNTTSAIARLGVSPKHSHQYYLLENGLDAQINQAFCSVAAAAAVLNSLRPRSIANLPLDPTYDPYRYATQADVFNDCVGESVISGPEGILTPPFGLSLRQVGSMLRCLLPGGNDESKQEEGQQRSRWNVKVVNVDPESVSLEMVRNDLMRALEDTDGVDSRVLINFHRASIGQVGGGHHSPIASYHPPSDSFLILDVAKYKYPPVWVSAEMLYRSLATVDTCGSWDYPSGQSRLPEDWKTQSWGDFNNILGCQYEYRGYIILNRNVE